VILLPVLEVNLRSFCFLKSIKEFIFEIQVCLLHCIFSKTLRMSKAPTKAPSYQIGSDYIEVPSLQHLAKELMSPSSRENQGEAMWHW